MADTALLFLIDQSGSMAETITDGQVSKAGAAAGILNAALAAVSAGTSVARQFNVSTDVCVLGFGDHSGEPSSIIPHGLPGWVPTNELDDHISSQSETGLPVWVEPTAENGTPMRAAMEKASCLLASWLEDNNPVLPPVLATITDGQSTDGDPSEPMQRMLHMKCRVGHPLLFNVQLSSEPNAVPVAFPSREAQLVEDYSRLLFRNSSRLTDVQYAAARTLEVELPRLSENPRGLVVNVTLQNVVTAVAIFSNKQTWQ